MIIIKIHRKENESSFMHFYSKEMSSYFENKTKFSEQILKKHFVGIQYK